MRRQKLVVGFARLSFLFLLCCHYAAYGAEERMMGLHEELVSRVKEYYGYEKSQRWEITYNYRSPRFRRAVGKAYYISTMKEDNKGWQMESFKIKGSEKSGEKVIFNIEFVERPPKSYFSDLGLQANLKEIEITNKSVWIKEGSEWYCLEAGTRTHIRLNSSVFER